MARHLTIGGSSAARTLACPGWIKASENIAKHPAGQAAIDGSMHHAIQETCQRDGSQPGTHLGFVYEEEGIKRTFTEDDLDLSLIAFNRTNEILDELDIDEFVIEPFVQLIEDVAGGSIDLLGLSADGETLLVLDYKFGRVAVSAEENAQLLFYTLGAFVDTATADMFENVKTVEQVIIQPQVKGGVSRWSCSRNYLANFDLKMRGVIEAITNDTAALASGPHCNYCPAAPYCKTKRQTVHSATLLGAKMHNELCVAADMINDVEDWLKSMKEELYIQCSRGVKVDGWKIVDKKATRKWVDEVAAVKALTRAKLKRPEIFKTVMNTPAQIEKALKKKKVELDLEKFIIKASSGTTLAHESDSREAVVVTEVSENLAALMDK